MSDGSAPGRALPAPAQLLARYGDDAAAALARRMRHATFRRGETIVAADEAIGRVFFLTRGLAAVIAPGGAEAGLLGPGDMAPVAVLLGARSSASAVRAVTPVETLAVASAALAETAARCPRLHGALMAAAAARLAEAEALCACAALHSVEQRLARWLAKAAELAPGQPIEVTHQDLADLFAVRRASVTTSLHVLEGEQAIRCRRGGMEVRHAGRLAARSCGCGADRPRT